MWCLVLLAPAAAIDANLREGVEVLPDGSIQQVALAKRQAESLLQQDDETRQVPSQLGRVLQRTRSLIAPDEEVVSAKVVVPRKEQLKQGREAQAHDLAVAHAADKGAYDPHDVEGVYAGPMANLAAGVHVPDPHDWSVTVCAGTGQAQAEEPLSTLCTQQMHFQDADKALMHWRKGDLVKNIREAEFSQGRTDRAKDFVLTDAVPTGEIVVVFEPRASAAPDLAKGQADIRKLRVLPLSAGQLLELFDQTLHGGFRGVFLDKRDKTHQFARYRTALVVSHGKPVVRNWGGNVSAPAPAAAVPAALAEADSAPADPEAVARLQQRMALEEQREQLEAARESSALETFETHEMRHQETHHHHHHKAPHDHDHGRRGREDEDRARHEHFHNRESSHREREREERERPAHHHHHQAHHHSRH